MIHSLHCSSTERFVPLLDKKDVAIQSKISINITFPGLTENGTEFHKKGVKTKSVINFKKVKLGKP